jgi:hypothetical protein
LRIDRKGVVVQIADLERGDPGAPPADLQTDREDRAVAQAGDDVLRRCSEPCASATSKGKPRVSVAAGRRRIIEACRCSVSRI